MLSNVILTQVKNIFNKIEQNDEFEIMFNNYKANNKLSIIKFMDALKYLKWRSDNNKLKLISETTLDIGYTYENQKNYRISIKGNDTINSILNLVHQRKNHIIFSILVTQFIKDENFTFINKTKDSKNNVDIDDYDIRFRKSSENEIDSKKLKELSNVPINDSDKIFYRYKQRVSLIILDVKDCKIQIDLTIIKSASNPNDLQTVQKTYELEIDFMGKPSDKVFDIIIKEVTMLKQVLEGTNDLITKVESKNIIEIYKKLTYGTVDNSTKLYSMQPISAEVQHVIDKIPNRYSVTDKLDGDKYQMLIHDENIYLISNNLNIKKIGKKVKNLDNTIIEGELFHLVSKKKYLFMGFDCLLFKGKDMRNESNLSVRLKAIEDTLGKIQNNIYISKPYSDKFDMDKQEKYYTIELEKFHQNLNKLIDSVKESEYVFHPKMFIFPTGGSPCEVYLYSYLIWTACTNSTKVNCPYELDGIIFTALDQKYTRNKKDHKYPTYKFKPPESNSIDIYMTFQRNPETGGYLEIYDNSLPINSGSNSSIDQVYRVANFYVGDIVGNKEMPMPFMREENNHEALFPLIRGEVRDIGGNFINDNTVVEVIYSNNPNIPHNYRWSILRTRWDKTEVVLRDQKTYGNFKDTAIKTWKSMREAVTIDEVKKLSNINTYNSQLKMLQGRINSSVITSDRAQDKYYQNISNLGKIMRHFHGWIKSIIIYTYCQPFSKNKGEKPTKTSVLDIGCGRGGDILKWFHARVGEYVGIDPNHEDLFASTDSIVTRYNYNKSKFPDFTKMVFIQADGALPLNAEIQSKRLSNMSQDNKNNITKYFDGKKKFDIMTFMFTIHYLFVTTESINNLINNIKSFLNIGGYMICTLFDAIKVCELLGEKNAYTSYYTDDNGEKQRFFEIVKKFQGEIKDEPGQAIDVMMSWVSQSYNTENLITPKLLIKSMEKAGCRLVDSDLFSNLYQINKGWFSDVISHEENIKNKKYYNDVNVFYGDLKGHDKESKIYSFLNRYYIFQKIE